jgi:hypothetical protein
MSTNDNRPVGFTQKQFDYLDKMYPERTGGPTTTSDELRFYAGQRSLIQFIKGRIQKDA